jgi:hypothetical protein
MTPLQLAFVVLYPIFLFCYALFSTSKGENWLALFFGLCIGILNLVVLTAFMGWGVLMTIAFAFGCFVLALLAAVIKRGLE